MLVLIALFFSHIAFGGAASKGEARLVDECKIPRFNCVTKKNVCYRYRGFKVALPLGAKFTADESNSVANEETGIEFESKTIVFRNDLKGPRLLGFSIYQFSGPDAFEKWRRHGSEAVQKLRPEERVSISLGGSQVECEKVSSSYANGLGWYCRIFNGKEYFEVNLDIREIPNQKVASGIRRLLAKFIEFPKCSTFVSPIVTLPTPIKK